MLFTVLCSTRHAKMLDNVGRSTLRAVVSQSYLGRVFSVSFTLIWRQVFFLQIKLLNIP